MAPTPTDPTVAAELDAVLRRLNGLHRRSIDLSLDRMHRLLDDLGRPQDRLPPVVHVAGTNGKGSTLAYMRAGLEAAGRRVHVYTSPHLVRFNERIRLAGRLIDDAALLACLQRCEAVNAGRPITFFEATTAAALLAFAETPADCLLLETGLGGRLDATNVIDRPALTAISPIALDHQDYLGPDIRDIAYEKAGIFRPEVPAVLAPQRTEVLAVLRTAAQAVGCPLLVCGRDWSVEGEGELLWRDGERELSLPMPALKGGYQTVNAGLALTLLHRLPGLAPDEAAMATALTAVDWPARLQRLTTGPWRALLPDQSELWLDGGHNPSAAEALAQTLGTDRRQPFHLVFAMLRSKDPVAFLQAFAPLAPRVWSVPVTGEQTAFAPAELAAAAASLGIAATPTDSVPSALQAIAAGGGAAPHVLICGTLYLAGEVLRHNGPLPE
jgi:dihydrofolate synthase/folylpolyglutamate synthase